MTRELAEQEIRETNAATHLMVEQLPASVRLLFDAIGPDIGRATRARGERPLLITATTFSEEWIETSRRAVKTAIRAAWPDPFRSITTMIASTERRLESGQIFELNHVLGRLSVGMPCICLFPPEHDAPEILHVISDAFVEIGEPTAEQVASALGLEDAAESLTGADFLPLELDFAVGRGRTPKERLEFLQRIRGMRLERERSSGASSGGTSTSGPRLEDLHGYGAAGRWGLQLVADLAAYRRGEIPWEDVDAGALFVGPPGTGKTLLAQALANSADVQFIATSYAQWQSNRSGHLGDVTKAIRTVFEQAAKDLPALIFIDEIDTVQSRGGTGKFNDGWFTAIVTCLLECLDGIGRREGIVVIAACNDDANLDAALVRSGRLDRRFWIDLPDETSLAGIFRHHLGDSIEQSAINRVATLFAGSISGADVVRIARDARRRARLAGRPIETEDLVETAVPADRRSSALRRRVAIHEAGHAVLRMSFGQIPSSLSLVETASMGGAVVFESDEATCENLPNDIDREVICALAGRAAEEIILGAPSAGAGGSQGSDLARATNLVVAAEGSLGFGETLVYGQKADGAAVHHRLKQLYSETTALVVRHRVAIEALADLALEKRVLGRAALKDFAKEYGFVR